MAHFDQNILQLCTDNWHFRELDDFLVFLLSWKLLNTAGRPGSYAENALIDHDSGRKNVNAWVVILAN